MYLQSSKFICHVFAIREKKLCGVDVARSFLGCDVLMSGAVIYCDDFIYSYYSMQFLVPAIFWWYIEWGYKGSYMCEKY